MPQIVVPLLFDFRVWLIIFVLGVIEVSVNLAKYYVGRQGLAAVQQRFPQLKPERLERIHTWFERAGSPVLLLMAVPVLSSLLAVTAGVHGLRVYTFVYWNSVAVVSRNWLLYLLIVAGYYQLR